MAFDGWGSDFIAWNVDTINRSVQAHVLPLLLQRNYMHSLCSDIEFPCHTISSHLAYSDSASYYTCVPTFDQARRTPERLTVPYLDSSRAYASSQHDPASSSVIP